MGAHGGRTPFQTLMRPRPVPRHMGPGPADKVVVKNVNVPGYTGRVDRTKYQAMKKALLKILPSKDPGLTQAEMFQAVAPHVPKDLFPDMGKVMWWAKSVQLDLEAKRVMVRDRASRPLRWRRT